jgi:hypothetical protein
MATYLRWPPICMAKGNSQKKLYATDSGLNFEQQLWAAAAQAVPAPHFRMTEYNRARPEGLCLGLIFLRYISDAFEKKREQLLFGISDPKGEWFIKDEPQRAEAAGRWTLATLRYALLPKLLSGELHVPAAAKLVEAAA